MKAFAVLFCSILSLNLLSQSANTTSDNAEPFCIGITYTADVGVPSAATLEPNNDYGCLFNQPNPSWYFLKAGTSGDATFLLSAPFDIDFIIYGPFSSYANLLSNTGNLNGSQIVDCSYSATSNETPEILGMQAGDYYLLLVTNYFSGAQDISLVQTGGTGALDCSVYTEVGMHYITGNAFYDMNENGIKDSTEYGIAEAIVDLNPLGANCLTYTSGDFHYYYQTVDSVFYDVSANKPNWALTTPGLYSFYLDSMNSMSAPLLFGFRPDVYYYSAVADLTNGPVFCINNNILWVDVYNDGTLPSSGTITVTLDADLTFISSSIPYASISGNSVSFQYDSLGLFQNINFSISTLPTTSLVLGDTIQNTLFVETSDSLGSFVEFLADTASSLVNCSYDPNIKESTVNGHLNGNIIQPYDTLEFTIHFQNTGTAPAIDVTIVDTLQNLIDPASFHVISSSHALQTSILNGNLIRFEFQNIYLPDSASNEPASHGYVRYSVTLGSSVLPNDIINNNASIFFDYNSPITTNTTHDTLDCFIKPDLSSSVWTGDYIETNLPGSNYSFVWLLDGDTITGETSGSLLVSTPGVYEVIAQNEYGCESTAMFSFITGLTENSANDIEIYPNPSNHDFVLNSKGVYMTEVLIFDESARLVFKDSGFLQNQYVISGEYLMKGFYIVQIQLEDDSFTFYRLIKL